MARQRGAAALWLPKTLPLPRRNALHDQESLPAHTTAVLASRDPLQLGLKCYGAAAPPRQDGPRRDQAAPVQATRLGGLGLNSKPAPPTPWRLPVGAPVRTTQPA